MEMISAKHSGNGMSNKVFLFASYGIGASVWPAFFGPFWWGHGAYSWPGGMLAFCLSFIGFALTALADPQEKWQRRIAFTLNLSFPAFIVGLVAWVMFLFFVVGAGCD